MKNSKEYAKQIGNLFRSLKQKHAKIKKIIYEDPIEALVYAIVSKDISEYAARGTMKKLKEHFVDFNDLRVSRTEEIVEIIGADAESGRNLAQELTHTLGRVYEKYNMVSLIPLKEMGKRPARKELEKLGIDSDFVINYCFMVALGGHVIALKPKMLEYLRAGEFVHPNATDEEIGGFLARQISAVETYKFYVLLREKSERGGKKTKKTQKKTAVKKTAAKTVNKKNKTNKKTKKTVKKATRSKGAGKT